MKILVIGESCKDIFNYGLCERLCPDAPAPVMKSMKIVQNPGMAMNVQMNIKAMGYKAHLYTNSNWERLTKTRFIDYNRNYMFMRLDEEREGYQQATVNEIEYDEYDAIIISDYNKGFLTTNDISCIAANHNVVFLDTKKELDTWCENIKFIKINNSEYKKTKHKLNKKIKDSLIVTLGGNGCRFQEEFYSVPEVAIKDSSGAGDTFIAALAVKYVESGDIKEAIIYANKCATEVVQKRGVSTP